MKEPNLAIQQIPIGDLKPSTYNPRTWDEAAMTQLSESIKRFGLIDPLIANSAPKRKNVVIGGHFRLAAAKNLKRAEVPVVYVNIPDIKKEKELNLRLNKNLGSWDAELLKAFDTDLLLEAGFAPDDLNDLFDDMLEVGDDGFDVGKELKKIETPNTKPGELYQLGTHRLLCAQTCSKFREQVI
jgi:hypothetical protein